MIFEIKVVDNLTSFGIDLAIGQENIGDIENE
jgi:hypothetical protein